MKNYVSVRQRRIVAIAGLATVASWLILTTSLSNSTAAPDGPARLFIASTSGQLLSESVVLDRTDVADAAEASTACVVGQHFDPHDTSQVVDEGDDIVTYGECLGRCRTATTCFAATFLASRDTMLRQREDHRQDGKLMPSPIPVLTLSEQLSHRSGRCRLLLCDRIPALPEATAMALKIVERASRRRAPVQPVTSWMRDALVPQLVLAPPGIDRDDIAISGRYHVLMLSALSHLHDRLLPALRTWTAGCRVSVFIDGEGSGLEEHQQSIVLPPHHVEDVTSALGLIASTALRYGSTVGVFNISRLHAGKGGDGLWLRRRSINGAWKPLVIVAAFRLWRTQVRGDAPPPFVILADDDTFMHLTNLGVHMAHLMVTDGQRLCDHGTMGERNQCSFALGERSRYVQLMSQKNFVPSSKPHLSTFLAPSMTSLDYLQGGGGIVMTTAFVADLEKCFASLFGPLNSTDGEQDTFSVVKLTEPFPAEKSMRVGLPTEFGDTWPAGDMRLAWAARECRRLLGANASSRLTLVDQPAFSHRSLELSLGADRRHWVSAFPVSFHRCRDPEDFDRLRHVLLGQGIDVGQAAISWTLVEGRSAQWWHTRLLAASQADHVRASHAAESIRRVFFDDEGFA